MIDMNNNVLVLAYLGDSIYEFYIRKYLIDKGIVRVNDLQQESIKYVSANSQAKFLKELVSNNYFNEKELDVIRKARNHKCNHKPKHCDIINYKYATALEALIGYLYYNNDINRINDIINYITKKELIS